MWWFDEYPMGFHNLIQMLVIRSIFEFAKQLAMERPILICSYSHLRGGWMLEKAQIGGIDNS
jgi:hypothetical protein